MKVFLSSLMRNHRRAFIAAFALSHGIEANADPRHFTCRIEKYPHRPIITDFDLLPNNKVDVSTLGLRTSATYQRDGDHFYIFEKAFPRGLTIYWIDLLDDRRKAYFALFLTTDLREFAPQQPSVSRDPIAAVEDGQCDVDRD